MRLSDGTICDKDYINILNLFSEYDYEENIDNFVFEYTINDERLNILKKQFDYRNLVYDSQFKTMVHLMVWTFENLKGDGSCVPPKQFDAETVLTQTRNQGIKANCYMYATVLNEIFLSMGFISRMVRCMPMDLDYNDCHCITETFCNEYNKWIIFDAANKAYYVDKNMIPLNLFELREAIRNKRKIYVPMMKQSQTNELIKYWSKNLVRFESYKISRYGNENDFFDRVMLHFQSKNFPVSDSNVYYEEMGIYINHIHTSNPNLFWHQVSERNE